ncbi:psbP-like protein 1, chloroplastic [Cinnamomum micranthum f. kanehirae]|uniref:PsbP-like protein 1, chloroplastic n=1 Tax=Cinnamomum micranthum f. kanehirae TaxID=337451 RepID=A0A3S3R516_9MAGN|nr:psbP-like protein 1, chloroplastic [Cinnamomum micranthum f. kanehirae]
MASFRNSPAIHHRSLVLNPSSQSPVFYPCFRRSARFIVKAEQTAAAATKSPSHDKSGRRQALTGGAIATCISLFNATSSSFAAEAKKGFQAVLDKKDGYSFLYPFGWQEVVIEGQDKVLKDVIEPLESVSVNIVPTGKESVRDLGSPQEVAEVLIKKVLAPPSQKTKLIEAAEVALLPFPSVCALRNDDGEAYYTFEFIAQAPNFTRHALGVICIGNGKFYTVTTGANERRWDKMKDRLHTVIDSFKIFNV